MANVIGLPMYRGNSEVYRPVRLAFITAGSAGFSGYFEGQAVNGSDGSDSKEETVYPTFGAQIGSGKVLGFICDINRKAGTATVIRATEGVVLPCADATLVAGDPVTIDKATGKIGNGTVGEVLTNGEVVRDGVVPAVDGKTGKAAGNACWVRFGALQDLGAV